MMMKSGEVEVSAKGVKQEETPTRLTTTLYELIAALQDIVAPDADALVVATVMHLLRAGHAHLRWEDENVSVPVAS
jgi:hypothetical protein